MKRKNKIRHFTKEEINKVMNLWEEATLEEIAHELGRPKYAVSYIANAIRKTGYKLPRKRTVGQLQTLIKDVLAERRAV